MLDNYEVIRRIKPSNNISEVWIIQDVKTKICYAMKIIKGINIPLFNVIFQREVGALNKLRTCENIVRLEYYDIDDVEDRGKCGRVFLEYIEGKTLQEIDVLELKNIEKYKIIEQLLNSIQIAHENNIIHRDINPKNIMIYDENKVKLIDFGISKIKDMVNTDTVFQFATNGYVAPEVTLHSENATEQSDIYSLGCVLFYIFTGEEPPIPSEFESILNSIGGIDIEVKKIIIRMVKNSKEERYQNIFEVKRDLLKLINDSLKLDKKYIITIKTGDLQYLKNSSLVSKNKVFQQILNEDIYYDFLESYIFVENENTSKEKFLLYGTHYYFDCFYDTEKQMFFIDRVHKLQPYKREEIKKKAMRIYGEVTFILNSNSNKKLSNNNFELTISTKDFKAEYTSSSNVNNAYTKNFYAWHKLMEIMEQECKDKALKIEYKSYKVSNGYCEFNISEQDFYLIDEKKDKDIVFIYEKRIGKKDITFEIGDFYKIDIEKDEFLLVIKVSGRSKISQMPKNGFICEDYRKNLALIKREIKAINSFNNEEYESSTNLKSIFSEILLPSSFNKPNIINYFNSELDPSQKRAVQKVINSEDIALIQGPPGTGKTNVIIEIIRQILAVNSKGGIFKQKILLVSQAHTAVDKMLEDLDAVTNNSNKIIRIGKDENLTEMVKEKFAIDNVKEKWIGKIIDKSSINAKKLLAYLQIDITEFYGYYKSKIEVDSCNAKINESVEYKKASKIVNDFEEKYHEQIQKKEFKALMIQNEWINRIKGDLNIQQYFIKNAEIVSGTCTGFVANSVINDMVFDYLIIDEAAKATFPELLISVIRAKKIIMVGDHKQLPPVLDDNLIRISKKKFEESNIDSNTLYDSIFTKLFEHLPESNKHTLNTQYRMHPIIGSMISKLFYKNEIFNGVPMEKRTHNIQTYKDLAIVWIDTSKCKDRFEDEISTSFRNFLEANIVKEQLKLIDRSIKDKKYDIGVITPYSAQKNLIRKEIKPISFDNINGEISVNSVDAFQGGQKDIIIYSTVRSSDKHKRIGFLKSEERLNVAFSRAKRLLIIVGDVEFLNNSAIENNKFPEIVKYLKENEKYCEIIDYLYCKNSIKEVQICGK